MALEFFRRAGGVPGRLGILPGTFNPVTVAHIAIGEAALRHVDEVVFVLPRLFPHKHYTGASFEQRIAMLCAAAAANPAFSVACSPGGLYIDIAGDCRTEYGAVELACICGRDAAERILEWDYGRPGVPEEMLRNFNLLVAARAGEYTPPPHWNQAIRPLALPGSLDEVSATEVRTRAAANADWEHLVPPQIREQVRRIYNVIAIPPDSPAGT
jgi:nicotinate (nicotinamide) nucleotide adenylyltransferase